MNDAAVTPERLSATGSVYALLAYGTWGFTPAFWKQLESIPASEVLAWRIIGTVVLTVLLLLVTRQAPALLAALRSRKQLARSVACGLLLGANWGIFIWAVNEGRILDTALGYYLTPLLNVAAGMIVFRERLARAQGIAVGLASAGVAAMAIGLGSLPWISLVLAITFSLYGILRKAGTVSSLGGLTVESVVMAVPAVLYLVAGVAGDSTPLQAVFRYSPTLHVWLAAGGIVTAFPLLCFAAAASRLPLSAVGLFQYIAPTIALVLAIGLYGEAFTKVHAVTFALIWSALALYTWHGFTSRVGARA